MKCPECKSTHINKNGQKRGKQNYSSSVTFRNRGVAETEFIHQANKKKIDSLQPINLLKISKSIVSQGELAMK